MPSNEFRKEFFKEKYSREAALALYKKYREYDFSFNVGAPLSLWFSDFWSCENESIDTESESHETFNPIFNGAW